MTSEVHQTAGEESASEGGVRDYGDAELAASVEERDLGVLDVKCEGAVFNLHGGDGVHGVGAAKGGCGGVGDSQVLHLAGSVRCW